MTKWRRVKKWFAVSDDGKSWRIVDWYGRYDTAKGWFDIRVRSLPEGYDLIDLPAPGECYWKRIGVELGPAITVEDVTQMMADLSLAYEAIGDPCRFNDTRYVY